MHNHSIKNYLYKINFTGFDPLFSLKLHNKATQNMSLLMCEIRCPLKLAEQCRSLMILYLHLSCCSIWRLSSKNECIDFSKLTFGNNAILLQFTSMTKIQTNLKQTPAISTKRKQWACAPESQKATIYSKRLPLIKHDLSKFILLYVPKRGFSTNNCIME